MPQRFGNTADAPAAQSQRFGAAEDARVPDEVKTKAEPGFWDMAGRAGGRIAHNIGETVTGLASALTTNPATTFEGMRQGTKNALDRMDQQPGFRKIPPMLGAIPLIGPAVEQFAGDIQEGNYPEAFGDAASALTIAKAPKIIPPVVRGTGKVLQMASKPAVLGTLGYMGGHAAGHAAGLPWFASAPIGAAGAAGGRALGKYLNKPGEPLKPPMAPPAAPAPSYPPLEGVPYEKLPPHLQQIVRDSVETKGAMPAPHRPVVEPRAPEHYGIQPPAPRPAIGTPQGVTVSPEAAQTILERVEHPPMAPRQPFPKGQRAREAARGKELMQQGSGVSEAAVNVLKDKPKGFDAAWKLRQSMMGGKR